MFELDRFPIYMDAFNLLCGKKLGSGIHRDVFECKLRPDLVVKVETNTDYREFANVREMRFWCDNEHASAVSKWLAPCECLSPDGRILLQKRCEPVPNKYSLPTQLPVFLTDTKTNNFGILDGRLVCVDYAITINNPSTRLRKAEFWD